MPRIEYDYWAARGALREAPLPIYAMQRDEDQSPTRAVMHAIERKSKLTCSGCSPQGISLANGHPQARLYELTFASTIAGGGHRIEGSICIAVPVGHYGEIS